MGDLSPIDNNQDPSSYFLSEQSEYKPGFSEKLKPILTALHYFLVQIWPYVNRVLNATFYFLLNLVREIVKMAIEQIKNFRGE